MRFSNIDNSEDIIDSRDVIARIEELREQRDNAHSKADDLRAEADALDEERASEEDEDRCEELQDEARAKREEATQLCADALDEDEAAELAKLEEFNREGENASPDWHYGVGCIRESYFEDHARELADDIHGKAVREASWPFDCIDWGRAADALQHDYSAIDFDGVTYYVR